MDGNWYGHNDQPGRVCRGALAIDRHKVQLKPTFGGDVTGTLLTKTQVPLQVMPLNLPLELFPGNGDIHLLEKLFSASFTLFSVIFCFGKSELVHY